MNYDFRHLSFTAQRRPSQKVAGAALVLFLHVIFLYILVGQTGRPSKAAGNGVSRAIEVSIYASPSTPKRSPPLPAKAARDTAAKPDDTKSRSAAAAHVSAPPPDRPNLIGGAPGQNTPSVVDPGNLSASAAIDYQKQLLARIESFKRYPADAGYQHPLGTVVVLFTIDRSGIVLGTWIKTTSGTPALDREAVATVLRAQPLPPIPQDLPDPLNIALPIRYDR